MEKVDIKIKQLSKQEFKGLQNSKLVLDISGKNATPELINTLRRMSMDSIPTYAFYKDTINIEKNTTIYDNDYMRMRLEQLTIPNLKNSIVHLPEQYWKDVNFASSNREKHPDDKIIHNMVINIKNDTENNKNVTSNDIKYYQDGMEIKDKFSNMSPLLIIKLRPGEEFNVSANAVLAVGKLRNIWSAVATSFYEETGQNKFKFTMESQGQMDEYEILYKACQILKQTLKEIKFKISNKYKNSTLNNNLLIIELDNHDHTIGNIIDDALKNNKNISYSGFSKPDLLKDQIKFKIISNKSDPLKLFFESIEYIIKLFDNIEGQIINLGKNFINK